MGKFIIKKRKEHGMTQTQLAEKLGVSFQAISKWENGLAYPNVEILSLLAKTLDVTVDEILDGCESVGDDMTYMKAGIDMTYMNSIKNKLIHAIDFSNEQILNEGATYASLFAPCFNEIKSPVLILKTEDPGTKLKLAIEYGYMESICQDMINHLVNDVVVMGGRPLAVLDTIVCENVNRELIEKIVMSISAACIKNRCNLVGGKTSVQPRVVEDGALFLSASVVGIVDRRKIVDGSGIEEGDIILGLESNGLHTSGYSLVRLLLDKLPDIKEETIEGQTFIEQIMKPHVSYYHVVQGILGESYLHGMAHVTGGGIASSLQRILPNGLSAVIDLSNIRILPVFEYIRSRGKICDDEMFRIFNLGIGFILIISPDKLKQVVTNIQQEINCYVIGKVARGDNKVSLLNKLRWKI